MKYRLTESLIKEYRTHAIESDHSLYLWDTELRGLGCYVSPNGLVSWIVQKWIGGKAGKSIRIKFGNYPSMPLDKARNRALIDLASIANGEAIPNYKKDKLVRQQELINLTTLSDAFIRYHAQRTASKDDRYWKEVKRLFERRIEPILGHNTPILNITKADIRNALSTLDSVPATKKFIFDFMRPFFKNLVDAEIIAVNPMADMKPPATSKERDRVLTDQEVIQIWRASEAMGFPFGKFFQLLLLTAQRRTELAGLRWDEINYTEKIITIPSERTKTDSTHIVPLSPQALSILESIPKRFEHVFCSDHRNPKRNPISGFSKSKAKLDKLCGVEDFTLHDFRRTAATGMARLRHPPHVIDKVLNHVISSKVRRIYLRFEYLDERRVALEDWGAYVARLVSSV
jgi:integrase